MGRDITRIAGGFEADETGVDRFTVAMRRKLTQKREEGRRGWNHPPYAVQADRGDRVEHHGCTIEELRDMLNAHISTGDPVDIANFAMMIWNRQNPNGYKSHD